MARRRKGQTGAADVTLVRTVPAGFVEGPAKDLLLAERPRVLALMNTLAADLHADDPLLADKAQDAEVVKRHISGGQGLKFAYAQRIGEAAADAVLNTRKQYLRRLRGCLLHCDTVLDKPSKDDPGRKRQHVPAAVEGVVTDAEIAALKALAKDGKPTLWTVLKAVAQGHTGGLIPAQVAVVADARAFCLSRYGRTAFGAVGPKGTDTFVLQLRLDERMFLGYMNKGKALFADLNKALKETFEAGKATFVWPLRLTALRNKGELIVPVTIHRAVWDKIRRRKDAEVSALSLEIGPNKVAVRAVLRTAKTTADVSKLSETKRHLLTNDDFAALAEAVNARSHIYARDIGMVSTTAHALVKRDAPVTVERLKAATFLAKDAAKAFLEGHVHDGSTVVDTRRNCGRDFLNTVAVHAGRIDQLRSKIDRGYTHLGEVKRCLVKPLKLNDPTSRIPEDAVHGDPFVQHLLKRFFHLLDRIRKLKALRIEVYRKIEAVKRCWFGWVTNREVETAIDRDAVVVREATSFVAVPTDDPRYKGRTFNRVLNNGARGKLERMASAKLAWCGVPEVLVPSFHTSSTDFRFGVVDQGQRRGEVFTAKADGKRWHADDHAAATIGVWLMMGPRVANATTQ